MLRKKEIIILLVGILSFSTTWASDEAQRIQRVRSVPQGVSESQQTPDPDVNTSVLVEAFVVRVSMDALAEAGVNSIGQSPEGISISKILWCLKDKENAEVISGAKVMAQHEKESESSSNKTFYIKRELPSVKSPEGVTTMQRVDIDAYNSGMKFEIRPWIKAENTIRFEYSYSESSVSINEDATMPPNQFNYDWSGIITAKSGMPTIAGAIQDDETVTFLILAATIQRNDTEKK